MHKICVLLISYLLIACNYHPNPDAGIFENRDERDTDERIIKLGWELVEYGKRYKTGYNTHAPGRTMAPRSMGLWELTKFGTPDSIWVDFYNVTPGKKNIHYLLRFKKDYLLTWMVEYRRKEDSYYIDGFMCDQRGSIYTASYKPYLHFGFTEEESIITQKGVLGFELGVTSRDEVYRDSLTDEDYDYLGIQFRFERDTLQEIKIEHQNHLKTKEGICFFSHHIDLIRENNIPAEETTTNLSYWYPSIPEINCYRYGNITIVGSNTNRTKLILIRNESDW